MSTDLRVIESISGALYSALFRDLPDLPEREWILAGKTHIIKPRRPSEDDVQVRSFPESWGSTALGYGGMGGSAITTAQTTIVACGQTDSAAIYWGPGGRLGKIISYWEAMGLTSTSGR
jgi:hypothetical protein